MVITRSFRLSSGLYVMDRKSRYDGDGDIDDGDGDGDGDFDDFIDNMCVCVSQAETDEVIDLCSQMQNLRTAILDMRQRAEVR